MANLGIVDILPTIAEEGDIVYYKEHIYVWNNNKWEQQKNNGSFNLTNYTINKMIIGQLPIMGKEELSDSKNMLYEFTHDSIAGYFMLLCNEKHDYTVFEINEDEYDEPVEDVIIEILETRGDIKQINALEDGSAIECWITDNEDTYMYMLFPYDWGVIKCQ